MDDSSQVQADFNKARVRARLQIILSKLKNKDPHLLSLYDVTKLIKPKSQNYLGVKPIPIDKIIGSEGRYYDFTKAFFPKKDMLKNRWQSIDKAYHQMVILPPISVFKISDRYFVRDGNHRVSVAKMQHMAYIDAEIVELDTEIKLTPDMSIQDIRKEVIKYERKRVKEEYNIHNIIDMNQIYFSSEGMYAELINHIMVHKYYINLDKKYEISFDEAAKSWYKQVFWPIAKVIKKRRLLEDYPNRTIGDMYMWIVRNWHYKKISDSSAQIESSVESFLENEKKPSWFKRFIAFLKRGI